MGAGRHPFSDDLELMQTKTGSTTSEKKNVMITLQALTSLNKP
jgi:hypothetical protein